MAEGVVRAGRFGGSAREGGGRALPPHSSRLVAVRAQVSRGAPPPLPGGYTVGEKVFFTGASQTLNETNKLVHGQQGEVAGPATAESVKGKGVDVLYPGNKASISCQLTQVRRLRAASAMPGRQACSRSSAAGRRQLAERLPLQRRSVQTPGYVFWEGGAGRGQLAG